LQRNAAAVFAMPAHLPRTLSLATVTFAFLFLSFGSLAGAQYSLPPETQVGPNCVGDPHHVQVDDTTVDLGRICVTLVVKDPDSGSGVDAETLDGLDSSQFLRSDVSASLSGSLSMSGSLSVAGELSLGSSGAACTAAKEGTQRYDAASKEMVYCDGTSWRRVGMPAGAVVAFDLANCPGGWTTFAAVAGRNIIGVGSGPGLTVRFLGDTGGEETHTLSVAEMPSHAHNIVFNKHFAAGGGNGDFGPGTGNNYGTDPAGGGAAHNVMDPYLALLYCKKL
jgi:hypothetical protein